MLTHKLQLILGGLHGSAPRYWRLYAASVTKQ